MANELKLASGPQKCVCFVSLEIYPTTPGGTGILISQTARLLLQDGYKVILLLCMSEQEFDRFVYEDRLKFPNANNLHAYRVQDIEKRIGPIPGNTLDDVYSVSVKVALSLIYLKQLHRIDLVEFYDYCGPGWHALACPALMQQPMVVRLHSTIELIARRVRNEMSAPRILHYHQERDQLRLADGILYPGENFFRREAQDVYPFLDETRALHSPPALLGFEPCPPTADARDVLFYGRLSTLKGLDTFIRAIALALADRTFDSWVRRIVVAGPEETVTSGLTLDEMLRVLPDGMRARLNFVGRLTHADLRRLLPDVAFAVFANKLESFCYAAHELRVSGVPLVLTNLPAFHDFFVDGESAIFFDGTAVDLAEKLRSFAQNPELRQHISENGVASASAYLTNHYDDHIAHLRPRRSLRAARALSVTPLIFSDGDEKAEARTLASLGAMAQSSVVMRPDAVLGHLIAGTRLCNDPGRPRADADATPIGDAVLGLRAGDEVDPAWLEQARIVLASDPRIGAVAGWRLEDDGLRTSADHLLAELALGEHMGLRRLIRIPPRLMFAELAGLMKNAGEVSLLLAVRSAGLASVELPRKSIDARAGCATPRFDAKAAFRAEADRLDVGALSLLPELAQRHIAEAVLSREIFPEGDMLQLTASIEKGLCRIEARPDVGPGEVWILRVHRREGSLRVPWSQFVFDGDWRAEKEREAVVARVAAWRGAVTFPASDDTTVTLLRGPFCGICEIFYGGRRMLIDLKGPEVRDVIIALRDFRQLTEPGKPSAAAVRIQTSRLEQLLGQGAQAHLLTVARPDGWTARRLAPPGVPLISLDELSERNTLSAAATLSSLQRDGQVNRIAIEIDSTPAFEVLELLVDAGIPRLTAILPGDVSQFQNEVGYAAAVLASSALAGLAQRAQERGLEFAIAAEDESLAPLFVSRNAPFLTLMASVVAPRLAKGDAAAAVAIVGASRMAHVRTHLVAAAMIVRQRRDRACQIFLPASENLGEALLREFRVFGIVPYSNYADLAGRIRGPAVALGVYPDPVIEVEIREAAAYGFAPLLGPSAFRWARDDAERADAARFRVEYWEDAQTIADAAEAILNDWDGARAAYDRLWRVEAELANQSRRWLWDASAPSLFEVTGDDAQRASQGDGAQVVTPLKDGSTPDLANLAGGDVRRADIGLTAQAKAQLRNASANDAEVATREEARYA